MLKKLIKYDLKNIYKVLIIFYSLSLLFAILTRIFLSIEGSFIINIIGKVCSGVTISMMFNILINNIMRLWARFKQNLYGDESYLTHTLPVTKETLYNSKIVSAFITLFTSILVIALTLFIAYYSKENIETLKGFLLPLEEVYNTTIIKILLAFFLVFFLEIYNALQTGYTGIILGHKKHNIKTGYSVIYGFITYTLSQLFNLVIIFIFALFNSEIMNLFFTKEMISVDIIKTIVFIAIFSYTLTLILNYFINLKLFKKGVNVD